MPDTRQCIYWDANLFLSYINEHPDRMPVLEVLLADSAGGNTQIYTSTLTTVEVAFAASEQQRRALDPIQEQRIDALWNDPDVVGIVEYHHAIGRQARDLLRAAMIQQPSLKPLDAIHLATAQWLSTVGFPITEFHTYDRRLQAYQSIVGFSICEPQVAQPRMI